MNINELNNLAESIKNSEKILENASYENVRKYCIAKHNEAYDIIYSVKEFIEKNFSLFDNGKGGWTFRNKQYHTEFGIGHSNPYNCVIRDIHHEKSFPDDARIYWIDNGIMFAIYEGVVTYVSTMKQPSAHGYGNDVKFWNTNRDYDQIPNFPRYTNNNRQKWAYSKVDENGFRGITEFNAIQTKNMVDTEVLMANLLVEKLMYSIRTINNSIQKRIKESANVLDESVVQKTTKYTIEVTKTEE